MRLIWYRRNDGLWNAACACNACIAGVAFEGRAAAEEWHEQLANTERARRAADARSPTSRSARRRALGGGR